MATLAEITDSHSKRISQLARHRDSRLQAASDTRDRQLRMRPAAARLYDAFDRQIADARDKQSATNAKAEGARASALQDASDTLREALHKAHQARRDADVRAFETRRKAEEEIEHEFILALAATPAVPSTDAQRIRAEHMVKAKKTFDAALAAAQEQFRQARDAALTTESQTAREANRAFALAEKVSEMSAAASRSTGEQKLAKALADLPEAAAEFAAWRKEVAAIVADYRRGEEQEFERFHREMEALKA
jgi:hypothetical protein